MIGKGKIIKPRISWVGLFSNCNTQPLNDFGHGILLKTNQEAPAAIMKRDESCISGVGESLTGDIISDGSDVECEEERNLG
jgi:hypothetical protein